MYKMTTFVALSVMFGTGQVFGQSVLFTTSDSVVTAAQITSGAPAGTIFEFFTTTSGDILSINQVEITVSGGTVYNDALGDDDGESAFAGTAGFERLQADTWLTTPTGGAISILGGGFNLLPDGDDLWGDATDDGAQAGFQFARITLTDGATGTFSGRVSIANGQDVFDQPFSFDLGGGTGGTPPTAIFANAPYSVGDLTTPIDTILPVTFDASPSTGDGPLSFEWDLGSGFAAGPSDGTLLVSDAIGQFGIGFDFPISVRVTNSLGSNIAMTTVDVIPEPASLLLASMGLIGIVAARRRRVA